MDEPSDTTTHTRLELGHAIDLELAKIAQGPPGEVAERARRELLQRHDDIARDEAERSTGCSDADEALRAARRGLQQAVRGFDPNRGVDFTSYAAARVRSAVRRCAARPTETSTHGLRHGRFLQVRVAMTDLHEQMERPPRLAEVADHLGYESSDVLDAMAVRSGERLRTAQLAAHLAADGNLRPDLTEAISELDERTRVVLYRVVCEGRSRRSVATELGLSTFEVNDLEQQGRRHLRRVASTD